MPDRPIVFDDLVRGEITFQPEHVSDYVLVRANGHSLYTLVNPVDDAAMEITHVLRGEDLLSSTPRQIALYDALTDLGLASRTPRFGHLPTVMNEGNKRFSKRDKGSGLTDYIERGFLPEGLLNYLALLGWGIADDRDVFSMAEMVEAFDIRRVNPNAARFDMKKCEAINASHMRLLPLEEFVERLQPVPAKSRGTPRGDAVGGGPCHAPWARRRWSTSGSAPSRRRPTCWPSSSSTTPPSDQTGRMRRPCSMLRVAPSCPDLDRGSRESLETWDTPSIEATLRTALVDGLGLKPRIAFGPVRVAVTGRRISPPLFESLDLLGRERSLGRLSAAPAAHAAAVDEGQS